MKAVLSIIDEHGRKYHGAAELSWSLTPPHLAQIARPPRLAQTGTLTSAYQFEPLSGIMHRVIQGGLPSSRCCSRSSPGGRAPADVPSEKVRSEWSKLTAHLGAFNRAHATRAKDHAWVDSPAHGTYRLGPLWREAFSHA